MSLGAVSLLAATGMANAYFLVGSFERLTGSVYGRVLIVKVALFAMATALGAWNLLVHKPRMEMEGSALESVRWNVWVEVALGTLIVGAVAILGTLPPSSRP